LNTRRFFLADEEFYFHLVLDSIRNPVPYHLFFCNKIRHLFILEKLFLCRILPIYNKKMKKKKKPSKAENKCTYPKNRKREI
jgi:hypothetical protein